MRRIVAFGGVARPELSRGVSSVACLAFVALLAVAFWAGALWISQLVFQLSARGF